MPAYNYIAINAAGEEKKGVLEGDTPKQVRQQLRTKNLTPIEVTIVASRAKKSGKGIARRARIQVADLSLMTRQLSTLLNAGLPVEEVLQGVADQTEKPVVQSLILGVRSKVVEGYSLAGAMDNFPRAFPKLYRATIAAGEKSSHLDQVLEQLADYIERQHEMRRKIHQALLYPIIMTSVSLIIVSFLLVYVVPSMTSVFNQVGQSLPEITLVLLALSGFIKSYGLYMLVAIIASVFILGRMLRQNIFLQKAQRLLLRLPVFGKTIRSINTARFSRTFGILFSAGVPVLEAMRVSNELITLLPVQNAVKAAIENVREGRPIASSLRETGYFTPMSVHLIASGERSGQLSMMLNKVSNYQDSEVQNLLESVLTLFEPILILIMGAIVMFIVLAILLPIFDMDQLTG